MSYQDSLQVTAKNLLSMDDMSYSLREQIQKNIECLPTGSHFMECSSHSPFQGLLVFSHIKKASMHKCNSHSSHVRNSKVVNRFFALGVEKTSNC